MHGVSVVSCLDTNNAYFVVYGTSSLLPPTNLGYPWGEMPAGTSEVIGWGWEWLGPGKPLVLCRGVHLPLGHEGLEMVVEEVD